MSDSAESTAKHDDIGWCVLELLGHRKLGGYVREVTVAGAGFLRIDVPHADPAKPALAVQFYPPSSVYCLTPTTEAMARAVARRCQPEPVARWELPVPVPAPGPVSARDDDDGFDPREDEDHQF